MSPEELIKSKLMAQFKPVSLEIVNDSHKHAGHAGSPNSGNSHFTVIIQSEEFRNISKIESYRRIHDCLHQEFQSFIHALSIKII